jgi:polysaccharide deacetylase family protein (PEP-CTERM system associated)
LLNILTIDLEEWYHPEYVRDKAASSNREDYSLRDLQRSLDLLEKHHAQATFFVLGETAKKHPALIKQIEERDHEIAFHGYFHELLSSKTAQMLQSEIDTFQAVLGRDCSGFRAPSFSLNNDTKWALDVLEKNRFKYDSSIFPASTPLYGVGNAPTKPYKPSHDDVSVEDENTKLWEFPPHVSSHALLRLPMAGGFYIRFFPVDMTIRSIEKSNRDGHPAVMFVHTWELNPQTPKLKLGIYRSFVTYHNLDKTAARLDKVLSRFEFTSVQNYMIDKGLW